MIYKTYAHCFQQVQQKTLEEIKEICMRDFYEKLQFQFITENESQHKCDISRYEMFKNFAKHLTLNIDNIIFQQSLEIGYLKSFCTETTKQLQLTMAQDNGIVNMFCNNHKIKKTISSQQFTQRKIQFCKNIGKTFGAGQFPIMTIHIIKIGNFEYFYYTIIR